MAFTHGKNAKIYMNGYDLSPYMDSIDSGGTDDVAEVSTFGTVQKPYVAGLEDGTISMEGFFDGDTSSAETAIAAAMGNSAVITWYPAGDTVGYAGYGMDADVTAHSVRATLDSAVRLAAAAQSSTGMEHVISLHAMGKEYSATITGTTVHDVTATSTSGGSAYIQVITADGTIAASIRHSTDNFAASNDELVAFTAVAADRAYQRVTFTGDVRAYVRCIVAMTAGETCMYNIGFNRA
jgi:hypothetical protein